MILRPIPRHLTLLICCTLLLAALPAAARQTVELPLTIDYPLLRNLLVQNAFPEKNETVTLVDEGNGCIHLSLAAPQLARAGENMRLTVEVAASAGTPIGGRCYTPVSWQGYLAFDERPAVGADNWQLSFATAGSTLLGPDGQPTRITDILWDLISPHIHRFIDDLRIDLLPPVTDLKNFLLPLFPDAKRVQTERMLASMRPGKVRVGDEALRFAIRAEVEEVFRPDRQADGELLDEADLRRTVAVWERWDGLLVYLITRLAEEEVTAAEKRTLTTVLLDTRYRFVNELSERTIDRDIVREQFVAAWKELAPIFRRHLLRGSDASSALGYLAFVASADILELFDRIGPTMGIEISTEGMVRLARMLDAAPGLLDYRSDINPALQKLFRFKPLRPEPPAGTSPGDDSSMLDGVLGLFRVREALAAEPLPSFEEILRWKVPDADLDDYLERIEKVLQGAARTTLNEASIPRKLHAMFTRLIIATAWQESCLRQFVVKGDKLTYLLSYNNTSVGLMQVNERVWRGLFRRDRLRWDIRYNAEAGSEIAAHYLSRYILDRQPKQGARTDPDTLARLVYAMYNGGPSQYDKFSERLRRNKHYQSDTLFWEKYRWVDAGELSKVSICLKGR